ncbi:hypothetical protein [Tomitella biformata]|uniref:hypothetical protein n=1 Tax=Tomitella biformata TaxID=630403 RepID=UPI0004643BC1|nr:hypothetical protein [Tomitella biformata]
MTPLDSLNRSTTPKTPSRVVVARILLALTLVAALSVSVANIAVEDKLNWWWVRLLGRWGAVYPWIIPLTVVVLAVGLGLSALVVRRSPRRVWGVAVCMALLVVSYHLLWIVAELQVVPDWMSLSTVSRLATALMTMFAAAVWLLATRRKPVAALASLAGLGLGLGATFIMDALWSAVDVDLGPGPRGWAAISEAYFWLVVIAVAITVWLGVLVDKVIDANRARPSD